MLRVANEGQMSVEDDGEKAVGHCSGYCRHGMGTGEGQTLIQRFSVFACVDYLGFNASIASGGTVTCSECGRPCQGKSSEGSPPALPMFWPPYIPESLFNSSA